MREDRPDPLAAFLRGPLWREEALPAFRRRLRELERAAISAPTLERLAELRAEHTALRHFADPDELLRMIRRKTSASRAGTDEAEDEPLADPQREDL